MEYVMFGVVFFGVFFGVTFLINCRINPYRLKVSAFLTFGLWIIGFGGAIPLFGDTLFAAIFTLCCMVGTIFGGLGSLFYWDDKRQDRYERILKRRNLLYKAHVETLSDYSEKLQEVWSETKIIRDSKGFVATQIKLLKPLQKIKMITPEHAKDLERLEEAFIRLNAEEEKLKQEQEGIQSKYAEVAEKRNDILKKELFVKWK